MVVVYLYGKGVFGQVAIQYVLKSFSEVNRAVHLISERIDLEFRLSIDKFGYKVFDCTDYTQDVRIIAESTELLK